MACVGIRSEDKSPWERRAPLTPDHVAELAREHAVQTFVEPSARRVFPDIDYVSAGAQLDADLSTCGVVLGVKEIPPDKLHAQTAYAFFSHVIKGQPQNMAMLRKLIELECTLIDYELITDSKGRRLIFFGRHAGYAGVIDSLWTLGQRLAWEGFVTPLADVRLAHQYGGLDDAAEQIARVGERIRHQGLPKALRPLVVAFTGEGNVSGGAQEIFDRLPTQLVQPEELSRLSSDPDLPRNVLYKVHLTPQYTVDRRDGTAFEWDHYVAHPSEYATAMHKWLPHITMLVHGIYWDPRYPRLVTREMLSALWAEGEQPRLRVIGDISCDIGGSVEVTVRATDPGDPAYVYNLETGEAVSGVQGRGPVIMAVDNLPCELPVESSEHFGDSLLRFVPPLARCDWSRPLHELALPSEIANAIVVHRGQLTPRFRTLEQPLRNS